MLCLQTGHTNPDLVNTGTPMMEHEQEKKRMGKPFPYMRPGKKSDSSPVPNFHGMPVRVSCGAAISRHSWTSMLVHLGGQHVCWGTFSRRGAAWWRA